MLWRVAPPERSYEQPPLTLTILLDLEQPNGYHCAQRTGNSGAEEKDDPPPICDSFRKHVVGANDECGGGSNQHRSDKPQEEGSEPLLKHLHAIVELLGSVIKSVFSVFEQIPI